MKALKKLGQGIAGNLGGGKLRKAMGGLGKGMLMEDGGKMKYPGGGRMSNRRLARMLAKYMMGGKMKMEHGGKHYMHGGVHEMEHGGKHYRHGGAHNPDGSPVQSPFDRDSADPYYRDMAAINERAMISRGDASSATPGEGVTLAFGKGSPVDFATVSSRFKEKNPKLFDPGLKYENLDGERVFYISDRDLLKQGRDTVEDPMSYNQMILDPVHTGRRKRTAASDTYSDIMKGMMDEFDSYVASFGDEIKNDPEKIAEAREAFREKVMSMADRTDRELNR
tara:strand:+ start:1754 stop:2593 length:840 start_codon:yes stop_codon:yes gene_type:complete